MILDTFKNVTGKIIFILGVILAGAAYVRTTYDRSTEAQACCVTNMNAVRDLEVRTADKVYDKMSTSNGLLRDHIDARLDTINRRLGRIEAEIKLKE